MQLPPGQQLVAAGKWPLVGERSPRTPPSQWKVRVHGLVESPRTFSPAELAALPRVERKVDIHCVTRWSKLGVRFGGVLLADLLAVSKPHRGGRFISLVAHSERNHSTSLELAEAIELGALLALDCDGRPLAEEHGGPVRVVVPGRYFYKSLKWLAEIELLGEDRLGYWEATAGYHNHADPWREERYMAPGLGKQEAAAMLATRDWSGRDLRSIDARGRELRGLVADRALLRDAGFRGCDLRGASFREANLSNAHFQGADLREANFAGADCEGGEFAGADLRGADFTGASLFGASFVANVDSPDTQRSDTVGRPAVETRFDANTKIDPSAIDMLTPIQQAFVLRAIAGCC